MRKQEFYKEIERRLEENKRVMEESRVPFWLKPLASYLGFHNLRVLVVTSLIAALLQWGFFQEETRLINKLLFRL